jgi:thiol-disulfide isomerase/thioredoxin
MNSTFIKILLIFCVLFPSLSITAQNETANDSTGIKFLHIPLAKALETSLVLNKPIFIDCYTTWCGPCKYLSNTIFPDKKVGEFYNANFICLKFDMEKDEGLDIAKKYDIKSYPTLLFLDANGEIMHKEAGSRNASSFIELGQKALNPELNSASMEKKIKNGEITPEIVQYILESKRIEGPQVEELLDKYFSNKPETTWGESSSWQILERYAPLKSRYGQYIINNSDALAKKYSTPSVDYCVSRMVSDFYYNGYHKHGCGQIGALQYLDSLNNPLVEKGKIRLKKSMGYSLVMQEPSNPEIWKIWFDRTALYQKKYDDNRTPGFPELDYIITNNKADAKYICAAIKESKHKYAPLAIQTIQFALVKSQLQNDKIMSQATIDSINSSCTEILKNCSLDPMGVNDFAWALVTHQQRDKFLQIAKKLSAYTLTKGDSYYWLDTYATICAQLLQFDEAIKYQAKAVEAIKKQNPDEAKDYQERYDKFVKHQPFF